MLNRGMADRHPRAHGESDSVSAEQPTPEEDLVVSGADWYGEDLSGRSYLRCSFFDTDWTEVVNEGGVFDACTFANVKFNASRHTAAAFTNCSFRNCTFFDVSFTDCKMVGSQFLLSTYTLFEASGGDWSFVGLQKAQLGKASFDGVRMREADLTQAVLDKARIVDVDLSGATLTGAKLNGADLRGSDLSALNPMAVELRGATISLEQAAMLATAMGMTVA